MNFNFKQNKTKMVGIRLAEDDYLKLQQISNIEKVSLAEAGNTLLKEALKEYKHYKTGVVLNEKKGRIDPN